MGKFPDYVTSVRIPFDSWKELNEKKEEKLFKSIAEGVLTYFLLGMKIEKFKQQIKDPEFLKSINELKHNDKIFEWLETLTESQKEGISFAIQIDRENHHKQEKFV